MKLILSIILSLFLFTSFCQDTIKPILPSPKNAAFLSLIVPGAGQVYNQIYAPTKKYNAFWKVPLIYISLVGSSSLLIDAIQKEKELKQEYYNRKNNLPASIKWINYDSYNLVALHESATRNRNLMFFLVGGIYLIQIIDASVEAHFTHFDISPNLSLNISPTIIYRTAGINLCFNFH